MLQLLEAGGAHAALHSCLACGEERARVGRAAMAVVRGSSVLECVGRALCAPASAVATTELACGACAADVSGVSLVAESADAVACVDAPVQARVVAIEEEELVRSAAVVGKVACGARRVSLYKVVARCAEGACVVGIGCLHHVLWAGAAARAGQVLMPWKALAVVELVHDGKPRANDEVVLAAE